MNWVEIISVIIAFLSAFAAGWQWVTTNAERRINQQRDLGHLVRNYQQMNQNLEDLNKEILEIKNLLTAACIIRPKE